MKKVLSKVLIWGSVAIAVGLLVFFMAKEYHEPYISSQFGWLKARLVAGGIGAFLAIMTFTGGKFAKSFKEFKIESGYLKDKNNADLEKAGYSAFEIWMIEAPLWGWLLWWVFCFEIMVSFHISDWLKHGF